MSETEKEALRVRYCQPDVCDLSLPQAFHKLLDGGEYFDSLSTVYRVMKAAGMKKRRDGIRTPTHRYKPQSYEATDPNQVWT